MADGRRPLHPRGLHSEAITARVAGRARGPLQPEGRGPLQRQARLEAHYTRSGGPHSSAITSRRARAITTADATRGPLRPLEAHCACYAQGPLHVPPARGGHYNSARRPLQLDSQICTASTVGMPFNRTMVLHRRRGRASRPCQEAVDMAESDSWSVCIITAISTWAARYVHINSVEM